MIMGREGVTLSALERALLDARSEQIALFDAHGRLEYLNAQARKVIEANGNPAAHPQVRAQLLARGARVLPLKWRETALGEAVIVAPPRPTLAEEEEAAVQEALKRAAGNRSQAARQLGISRTTLWRRLTGRNRVHARRV
ncbi:MAG TPA: helix-turn-helix domain-containing protein [Gemmatimonadales bacterium]|nr:helix-turn-helix domain-containing protein [Gemmatimonadales bacterium]